MAAAVTALVAGCGGDGKKETSATSEAAPATTAAEPASTAAPESTAVASDDTGGAETSAPEPTEDVPVSLAAGKTIFMTLGCAACHTLAEAGARGTTGPDLDKLKPDAATVAAQVVSGGGGMPSFADKLTETDIRNLSAYIVEVAGKQ